MFCAGTSPDVIESFACLRISIEEDFKERSREACYCFVALRLDSYIGSSYRVLPSIEQMRTF